MQLMEAGKNVVARLIPFSLEKRHFEHDLHFYIPIVTFLVNCVNNYESVSQGRLYSWFFIAKFVRNKF